MFYSHSFLVRKGPIASVWRAAHLDMEGKLKKTQYHSVDIESTIDHILNIPVPVSLRLSAILLFGLVRIYSKKVDNVLRDCNNLQKMMLKVYPVIILPKNTMAMGESTEAARNALTLPENFQLDELNFDFEIGSSNDSHTLRNEDITLQDQNVNMHDRYFTVRFDEDDNNTTVLPESMPISSSDDPTPTDVGNTQAQQQPDPTPTEVGNTQAQQQQNTIVDPTPTNVGDTQAHQQQDISAHPEHTYDDVYVNNDDVPQIYDHLYGGHDMNNDPFVQDDSVTDISDEHIPKKRKRNYYYDDPTVLSNRVMRRMLNDTTNIRRKRKDISNISSGDYIAKRIKQSGFNINLHPGICNELLKIQDRDYILSKYPIISNHVEDVGEVPPNNPEPTNNNDIHDDNVDDDEDPYIPETDPDNHETYVPEAEPFVNDHEELPAAGAPGTSTPNNDNLTFLEEEHVPPKGKPDKDNMATRTSALASYLNDQSNHLTTISLFSILGLSTTESVATKRVATKRVAARLVFELLTLASFEVVELHQGEAYGDVTIKVAQKENRQS